jgi:hypothetical protein
VASVRYLTLIDCLLSFWIAHAPGATNIDAAWPYSPAAVVIEAWQGWGPPSPDELAASLQVTASADMDEPPTVDVYAALLGT